jgi:DNA-binding MarR family transcriptional regulator
MRRENLTRNFGFLVNDVARAMRTEYDRRVRGLGLTRSQWWVMNHLYRNPGLTQSELAAILEVEKPSVGRLLDRLEAKGWVRREHDPRDRRAWRVYLAEGSAPQMRALRKRAVEMVADALAGLPAKDRERLIDLLLAVKANLARRGFGG